jgi:type IV pilus assembly protein PilV
MPVSATLHLTCRGRRARGFTLIEVLISVLIFSFGILGTVGMQARALQASTQNQDRSRASMLANEAVSEMWSQQSTTLPLQWYAAWQARVSSPTTSGLPSGTGSVAVASGVATITVKWRPTSVASTTTMNQYVTTVVIP